jgi:hypothetical protein
MKQIEIKLPATVQDCTPEMMTKWLIIAPVFQDAKDDLSASLDFQCQVISIFSGLSLNQVRKAHIDDVIACFTHIMQILGTYKQKEIPSGRVTIEGQVYCFDPDFSVISTGQIIDMKLIESVQEDPCQALAICYIEEGMEYCQEDSRGKILNPSSRRKEIFKRAFPGDEFIDFFAFFLHQSELRKLAILEIQKIRMKEELKRTMKINQQMLRSMTANGLSGRVSSFSWLRSFTKMWTRLQNSRTSKRYSG